MGKVKQQECGCLNEYVSYSIRLMTQVLAWPLTSRWRKILLFTTHPYSPCSDKCFNTWLKVDKGSTVPQHTHQFLWTIFHPSYRFFSFVFQMGHTHIYCKRFLNYSTYIECDKFFFFWVFKSNHLIQLSMHISIFLLFWVWHLLG